MKRLFFNTTINASAEKVWNALWEDKNYREWTKVFTEGSHVIGDYKQGSIVKFMAPDGSGMYSQVEKNIPNEFMSFKHIGEIKNGIEQPVTEADKSWTGAMENYILTSSGAGTQLQVEVDVDDKYADDFEGRFPKGLSIVKEISER